MKIEVSYALLLLLWNDVCEGCTFVGGSSYHSEQGTCEKCRVLKYDWFDANGGPPLEGRRNGLEFGWRPPEVEALSNVPDSDTMNRIGIAEAISKFMKYEFSWKMCPWFKNDEFMLGISTTDFASKKFLIERSELA